MPAFDARTARKVDVQRLAIRSRIARQRRRRVSRSCSALLATRAAVTPNPIPSVTVSGHHGIARGEIRCRNTGMTTPAMRTAFMSLAREGAQELPQIIAHAAERRKSDGLGSFRRSGIVKIAVKLCGAGEDGTALLRAIADRDHVVEALPTKFVHVLGPLRRDVDADFAHHGNRLGADDARLRPGALDGEGGSGVVTEQPLGHLAAGRVSRAEDQDARRGDHAQHPGAQHDAGFDARMNALMNLPSTCGAIASTSMPCPERKARASSMS